MIISHIAHVINTPKKLGRVSCVKSGGAVACNFMGLEPVVAADADHLLGVIDAAYMCVFEPGHVARFLEFVNLYLDVRGAHLLSVTPQQWELRAVCESELGAEARYGARWAMPPVTPFDLSRMAVRQIFSFAEFAVPFAPHLEGKGASGDDWSFGFAGVLSSNVNSLTMLVVPLCAPTARQAAHARLQRVIPYLARAFMLMKHSEDQVLPLQAVGTLLRRFPLACLLTDAVGRCIDHNEVWERVRPEMGMKLQLGRVGFEDSKLQCSWHSALFDVSETSSHRSLTISAQQGKQWTLHLQPIRCGAGVGDRRSLPLILVVFEELAQVQRLVPDTFAMGRLTPAEMEVLSGLLQGYTAKVIARARGASVNTVRSQIMAILEKTGRRSQKELIAAFGASSFDPSSLSPTET